MLEAYVPIVILALISLVVGGGIVVGNALLGPRHLSKTKLDPFECGSLPSSTAKDTARKPYNVKFYMVAIVFLLFDIETVFLIPWAVLYAAGPINVLYTPDVVMMMFVEMVLFVVVLLVGLWYLWKKGGLQWD